MIAIVTLVLLAQTPYHDYIGDPKPVQSASRPAPAAAAVPKPARTQAKPAAVPSQERMKDEGGRMNETRFSASSSFILPTSAFGRVWVTDTAHPGWQGFGRIRDGWLVDVTAWRRISGTMMDEGGRMDEFHRPLPYSSFILHPSSFSQVGGCANGYCPQRGR